jgi:uncharacterized membrane-anchored protein
MSQDHTLVNAAQAEGVLPARASEIANDPSPSWVITTLSFIGAQFTVWPFLLLVALIGGKNFYEPPQSFVLAAVLIVGAVLGLRASLPIFVSHLCFSALLTGMGLLVFSLFFAMKVGNLALVILLLVNLGAALTVRVPWVQRLLGLGAAVTAMLIVPNLYGADGSNERPLRMMYLAFPPIINTLLIALAWAAWCALEIRLSVHKLARNTGAFMDGVGVALLAAQVFASGALFTSGGVFDSGTHAGSADSPTAGTAVLFALNWVVVLQVAITMAAWWWLIKRWQLGAMGKRREWALLSVVYLCLAVFSFFTRDGGVVAIVGTVALATGRTRVLALAVFVLLAQLSGFYYALAWPLVHKAGLLVVVGAFIAAFLWALRRQFRPPPVAQHTAGSHTARPALTLSLVALGGILSLGAANYDVMKKEQVITGGQKIYVALAPRDPRSLMQGDFMALNFGFPRDIQTALDKDDLMQQSVTVVAALDSKGVATVLRVIDPASIDSTPLPSGQVRLPLKHKGGQWVLVTDAFYFPEGRGESFKQAKFGEFRALADGRALLVGLADESLRPLEPSKEKSPADAGTQPQVEELPARPASH